MRAVPRRRQYRPAGARQTFEDCERSAFALMVGRLPQTQSTTAPRKSPRRDQKRNAPTRGGSPERFIVLPGGILKRPADAKIEGRSERSKRRVGACASEKRGKRKMATALSLQPIETMEFKFYSYQC